MNVPRHELSAMIKLMAGHYVGRLYKMYCVNAPGYVSTLFSVIKGMLSDRQQQKIFFLKDHLHGEFIKDRFAHHQVEKKYGGNAQISSPFTR